MSDDDRTLEEKKELPKAFFNLMPMNSATDERNLEEEVGGDSQETL
jgi:hypothetical protein